MTTRELLTDCTLQRSDSRIVSEGRTQAPASMSESTVIVASESKSTSKSKARHARKLAKSDKRKQNKRPVAPDAPQRFALNVKTGGALVFKSAGALGGRGARTSAIENVLAKSGAKGATIREIENATSAAAVAMHIRTLYSVKQLLGRKRDELTGAFRYYILSAKKNKKSASKKTSAKS